MSALEKILLQFLKLQRKDDDRPLLIAFSGGPDSLALVHACLECRKRINLSIGLAHVDHAWRLESFQEAEELKTFAAKAGMPFHLKRLNPKEINGNLEEGCRKARLNFFSDLCSEFGYQAVLFGHHADDQAETVLKRIFEGASLVNLSGMSESTHVDGVTIWRPFLRLKKQEILHWLNLRGLKGFSDSTNSDPRFLRGKMRTSLIPSLAKEFGKEIVRPLLHLGEETRELRDFVEMQTSQYMTGVTECSLGLKLDLTPFKRITLFELKYVIRRFCGMGGGQVSKPIINLAAQFILDRKANCRLIMGKAEIYIDRGCLFLLAKDLKGFEFETLPLTFGDHQFGPWRVEVSSYEKRPSTENPTGWKGFWQEGVKVILPKGEYELGTPLLSASLRGNEVSLKKWWTDHKIPAFLRMIVPVIWQNNQVRHEFLTGSFTHFERDFEPWVEVKVSC